MMFLVPILAAAFSYVDQPWMALSTSGATPVTPVTLFTSIAHVWHMEEGTGSRSDSVGGIPLIEVGGTVISTNAGICGRGAWIVDGHFLHNASYVFASQPQPGPPTPTNVPTSLSVWFNSTGDSSYAISGSGIPASGDFFAFTQNSFGGGTNLFLGDSTNGILKSLITTTPAWHLVVFTYDGGIVSKYSLDGGVRQVLNPNATAPFYDIDPGFFRQSGYQIIDEVYIWNRELTDADCSILWNSGTATCYAPSDIGGMAYYWNYLDLPNGGTVTNWVDRIQGIALTNGDSAKFPTNTSSGVHFDFTATTSLQKTLTNITQTLTTTNFSTWIVFKTEHLGTWQTLLDKQGGAGTSGYRISNGNKATIYPQNFAVFDATSGVQYDWVTANAPSGSPGSWTNGVATVIPDNTLTALSFDRVGSDTFDQAFFGHIKFIGIWTNRILNASDAANLYSYSSSH